MIDLHIHSYYSDGEYSPDKILDIAIKEKLKVFSITDHNFIPPNLHKIKKRADNFHIKFIDGVEMSSSYNGFPVHILGYSKNFLKNKINKKTAIVIRGYNNRAMEIIQILNKKFPKLNLSFDFLKKKNPEVYVSRNTIIKELINFHHAQMSRKEAKSLVFLPDEDNSWMLNSSEAIDIIKKAGGISVLAHSGNVFRKFGKEKYEQMILAMMRFGLRGIEIYYPQHSAEEIKNLKKIARNYNLIVTGGSDWHGYKYFKASLGSEMNKKEFEIFYKAL